MSFDIVILGQVVVRCSQTGKLHIAKLKDLARADFEALSNTDLVTGSTLMFHYKGKPYPVQFIRFKGQYNTMYILYSLYKVGLHHVGAGGDCYG